MSLSFSVGIPLKGPVHWLMLIHPCSALAGTRGPLGSPVTITVQPPPHPFSRQLTQPPSSTGPLRHPHFGSRHASVDVGACLGPSPLGHTGADGVQACRLVLFLFIHRSIHPNKCPPTLHLQFGTENKAKFPPLLLFIANLPKTPSSLLLLPPPSVPVSTGDGVEQNRKASRTEPKGKTKVAGPQTPEINSQRERRETGSIQWNH